MRTTLLRIGVFVLLLLIGVAIQAQQPWDDKQSLHWNASPTPNVQYNVYRRLGPCTAPGQFTKLNATPVAGLALTDSTVKAGNTYCFAVTAVDADGIESVPGLPNSTDTLTVSLPARPAAPSNLRRNP